MKTIVAVIICVSVLISSYCLAANGNDVVAGQIVGNFEGKFKLLLGDKAITNLGKKNGVIKGDIYTIYSQADSKMVDPIGRCAVVEIYDSTSVCEIIKMKREIGIDVVSMKKLKSTDQNLLPPIFTLLSKVVEPYAPEKQITVFVYDVFDENHNVTKFSEKVKNEVKNIFFQKKRIKPAGQGVSTALFAYLPGEYNEYNKEIEGYLQKDGIDVIISGTYRMKGENIELSFYKIDKNWEDLAVDTLLSAKPYAELIATVTMPYTKRIKEKSAVCNIVYKPVYHKTTSRDERNDIVSYETKNNPILEYTLRKSQFNIIAPVDFTVKIGKSLIKFDKAKDYQLPLTTGKHEITASFKKGFYYNDQFLVALSEPDNIVKKNAIISIDNPEDLVVEIEANPLPKRESISFKVYRKSTRSSTVIKPVLQRETFKPVETFKD